MSGRCQTCAGAGFVDDPRNWSDGGRWLGGYGQVSCPDCSGTGRTRHASDWRDEQIRALTELVAKLGDRLCACAEILGRLAEKRNGGEG